MADQKKLEIILSGKDEATQAFTNLQKSIKSLEKTFSQLDTSTNETSAGFDETSVSMGDMITAFVTGNIVATIIVKALTAVAKGAIEAAKGTAELAFSMGMTASSVNEAKTALDVVAQTQGLNIDTVEEHRKSLEALNLTTKSSTGLMIALVRAQVDTAKGAQLARTAQDLAVVSQVSSTEAIERITHAVQTQNVYVLRGIGITQNALDMYDSYAVSLGKSSEDLTTLEKKQAIVNTIIEEGANVAGLYEKSLGTASKSLRSLNDRLTMIKESLGNVFAPFLDTLIPAINAAVSGFVLFLRENEDYVRGFGVVISEYLMKPFEGVVTAISNIFTPMKELQKEIQAGTDTAESHASAIQQVIENLEFLITPINIVGNGVAGLAGIFMVLQADVQLVISIFKLVASTGYGVAEVFAGMVSVVGQLIAKFLNLNNVVSSVAKGAVNIFSTMGKGILSIFGNITDSFDSMVSNLDNKLTALNEEHESFLSGEKIGLDTTLFEKGLTRIQKASLQFASDVTSARQTHIEGWDLVGKAITGQAFDIREAIASINPVARQSITGIEAIADKAVVMSAETKEALEDITEKMLEETDRFIDSVESRTRSYQEHLNDILWKHLDKTESLQEQMGDETDDFSENLKERKDKYDEYVEEIKKKSEEKRDDLIDDFEKETRSLRENLLRMLSSGIQADQDLIAKAREDLVELRAEKAKALADIEEETQIAKAKEAYEEDVANLKDASEEKLLELQETLDEELALQEKYSQDFNDVKHQARLDDIAQAKADFDYEMQQMRDQHNEKMTELRQEQQEILGVTGGTTGMISLGGESVSPRNTQWMEYINNFKSRGKNIGQYFAETGQQGTLDKLIAKGVDPENWLSRLYTRAAEGTTIVGTGPKPVIAHGGETILTTEQTKGLLKMLSNYSGDNQQKPVNVNNYVYATVGNDYDVDRLAERLSNSFRNKGRA